MVVDETESEEVRNKPRRKVLQEGGSEEETLKKKVKIVPQQYQIETDLKNDETAQA